MSIHIAGGSLNAVLWVSSTHNSLLAEIPTNSNKPSEACNTKGVPVRILHPVVQNIFVVPESTYEPKYLKLNDSLFSSLILNSGLKVRHSTVLRSLPHSFAVYSCNVLFARGISPKSSGTSVSLGNILSHKWKYMYRLLQSFFNLILLFVMHR